MRSSTSSSDPGRFERAVPRGHWAASALIAAFITLAVTVAWEVQVRAMGYEPSLNETSDLWARTRSRVGDADVKTVIVGSSRAQFDIDLGTWATYFGEPKPVQLAMPGTSPVELLESVVASKSLPSTVVLGVTPMLWFVPEGMPVDQAKSAVGRYDQWSPSQRMGLVLGEVLQRCLAFLNPEDLDLAALLDRVEMPDRAAASANQPPLLPPYFAGADEYRQARMWKKCDFGTPLAQEIQRRWIRLFTPPPPPPGVTPDQFREMFAGFVEGQLGRVAAAVGSLQERGVRVVFVRFPSTGRVREMETQFSPRPGFYDRLLAVTGAPGIHFEDYPELASFDCPEWSHLTREDAVRFTERLMPLVEKALAGE